MHRILLALAVIACGLVPLFVSPTPAGPAQSCSTPQYLVDEQFIAPGQGWITADLAPGCTVAVECDGDGDSCEQSSCCECWGNDADLPPGGSEPKILDDTADRVVWDAANANEVACFISSSDVLLDYRTARTVDWVCKRPADESTWGTCNYFDGCYANAGAQDQGADIMWTWKLNIQYRYPDEGGLEVWTEAPIMFKNGAGTYQDNLERHSPALEGSAQWISNACKVAGAGAGCIDVKIVQDRIKTEQTYCFTNVHSTDTLKVWMTSWWMRGQLRRP